VLGAVVGTSLSVAVGGPEEPSLGLVIGSPVDWSVGVTLSCDVGASDAIRVGLDVALGIVGLPVVVTVGDPEGPPLGIFVCGRLGWSVGVTLGRDVVA
jgi:hypothetical protein